jgi:hypothetical protein
MWEPLRPPELKTQNEIQNWEKEGKERIEEQEKLG